MGNLLVFLKLDFLLRLLDLYLPRGLTLLLRLDLPRDLTLLLRLDLPRDLTLLLRLDLPRDLTLLLRLLDLDFLLSGGLRVSPPGPPHKSLHAQ